MNLKDLIMRNIYKNEIAEEVTNTPNSNNRQ